MKLLIPEPEVEEVELSEEDKVIFGFCLDIYASGVYWDEEIDEVIKEGLNSDDDFKSKKSNYYILAYIEHLCGSKLDGFHPKMREYVRHVEREVDERMEKFK